MSKKPRKWSNLAGKVPEDPSHSELTPRLREVLKRKDERADKPMGDLAEEWASLEEEEEFEKLAHSERSLTFDALEKRILEELKKVEEVAGTDMWRGDGQTFSPRYVLQPHVEDPEAFMKWIYDTGQQHLLTVPIGRLKSIVGEAMNTDAAAAMTPAQRAELKPGEAGSGAPPPGVRVTLYTTITHTAKKKQPAPPVAEYPTLDDDVPF